MAQKQHYQVIVVGAGMAGTTAAYFLAKSGARVLLLERGPFPGSKNMSGGAIYSLPTRELFPDFWQDAPVERALIDQQYWLMTENSAVRFGYTGYDMGKPPYNKFSVMRAKFDKWYAEKAVGAGAELWTSCKAEELVFDNKRVCGVKLSGSRSGVVYADIVILAQGANALLAEKAGLIKKPQAKNYGLYIKEMIALPEEVINERFHLEPGLGSVIGLLGDNTAGLIGTGSIYTFKQHIGLNVGVSVKTLAEKKVNPGWLLARLKEHPVIKPLISGGTTVEYLAHMIPEGGYNAMPKLVFDGMLITGDSGALVNGTHGLNLAMYSGKYAADTAIESLNKGNFSQKILNRYQGRLEKSFVLKDLKDNRKVPAWFSNNPTLVVDYIGLVNHVAMQLSTIYPVSRKEKREMIRKEVLAARPAVKLLADMFHTLRVVRK